MIAVPGTPRGPDTRCYESISSAPEKHYGQALYALIPELQALRTLRVQLVFWGSWSVVFS